MMLNNFGRGGNFLLAAIGPVLIHAERPPRIQDTSVRKPSQVVSAPNAQAAFPTTVATERTTYRHNCEFDI